MRTLLAVVTGLALATGCTVDDRMYTGPMISMQLTNNGVDRIQDTDPMPAFQLGTDTSYSIDIEIFTQAGSMSTKSTTKSSQVTAVTTKLSLAGQDLPSPSYDKEAVPLDPTFTSHAPVAIPASAMGGMLVIHATAVDGDGLDSNVIDLSIALQ